MYTHSLLHCHHLEENMWLITSEKIDSQTNISVNEPPSLLSWHKLDISAVPITQQAARSWALNHCMTFTAPSFHVSLQILHFAIVLLCSTMASSSRVQPCWGSAHWKWIVGFQSWLWFQTWQSTAEQHHAAYYPPWAWSATAAGVTATTAGAYASSKSKLSVVFRRHYVSRKRELACWFIKTDPALNVCRMLWRQFILSTHTWQNKWAESKGKYMFAYLYFHWSIYILNLSISCEKL